MASSIDGTALLPRNETSRSLLTTTDPTTEEQFDSEVC
jgi:hypothetical protein